jgi:hypothetical protein
VETPPKKLWIHADNARRNTEKVSIHFLALNEMKKARHPPHSPDLAPSDFFLFGYVKRNLIGYRAGGYPSFWSAFNHCEGIPGEALIGVVLEWMKRCIDIN